MFCPECGKSNPEDLQYCRYCNAELIDNYPRIASEVDNKAKVDHHLKKRKVIIIFALLAVVLIIGVSIAIFATSSNEENTFLKNSQDSSNNLQTTSESNNLTEDGLKSSLSQSSENDENIGISYYQLYQPIIDEYYLACQNEHSDSPSCFCGCAFYDIDEDGIDELIVEDGVSYGGRKHHFYKVKDNQVVEMGEYASFHSYLYYEDGKLYAVEKMQGVGQIMQLTVTENGITEKLIGAYDNYDDMPTFANSIGFIDLFLYSSYYY